MANVDVQPGENERPGRQGKPWWFIPLIALGGLGIFLAAILGGKYLITYAWGATEKSVCTIIVDNHFGDVDKNGVWHWRYVGRKPAVPLDLPQEQRAAQARANVPCFLKAAKVTDKVASALAEAVASGKGERVLVKNGTHYNAVSAGGPTITFHAVTDFAPRTPRRDRMATRYAATVDSVTYYVDIFDKCGNLGLPIVPTVPHKSRHQQRKVAVQIPPPVTQCYRVYYDNTGQTDVDLEGGRAHYEVHLGITSTEMQELEKSNCFYVHDDTAGDRKPDLGCDCEHGGYPNADLAEKAGLPAEEPEGIFHWAGATKGYVSYPLDFFYPGLYCVRVNMYSGTTPGYESFKMFSRFDIVPSDDVRATQKEGRLNWVVAHQNKL